MPLEVVGVLDGTTWKVRVNPGFVFFSAPGTDHAPIREYFEITGTGDTLYAVSDGDRVYAHVTTNARGKPLTYVIEIADSGVENVHYVPDTPDEDGSGGDYFYELARISISGSVMTIVPVHVGAIEIQNQLWASESEGEGVGIIEKFNEDTGKYALRGIKPKEESPMNVEVSPDGKSIDVSGNGYDTTVTDSKKFSITIKDGLVESATDSGAPGVSAILILRYTAQHDNETTIDIGWKLHFNEGVLEEAYSTANGGGDWFAIEGTDTIQISVSTFT
jgi:hypothetical protein